MSDSSSSPHPLRVRLWRGDVSLGKTFAVAGLNGLALLFFGYLLLANLPRLWSVALVALALSGFGVLSSLWVWRAAEKSSRALTRTAAKVAVVLGWIGCAGIAAEIAWLAYSFVDLSGVNSQTIGAQIQSDEAHPLIGFWKDDCAHDFGFVLEKGIDRGYTVRFCGPGGCSARDSWRSTVVDDPLFQVFDDGAIGIRADAFRKPEAELQGWPLREGFLSLRRCPTSAAPSSPIGKATDEHR